MSYISTYSNNWNQITKSHLTKIESPKIQKTKIQTRTNTTNVIIGLQSDILLNSKARNTKFLHIQFTKFQNPEIWIIHTYISKSYKIPKIVPISSKISNLAAFNVVVRWGGDK